MNPFTGQTISKKYWNGGYLKECETIHVENRETRKILQHRHYEFFKFAGNYCSRDLKYDSDS
jgi:hypothetical protein